MKLPLRLGTKNTDLLISVISSILIENNETKSNLNEMFSIVNFTSVLLKPFKINGNTEFNIVFF